MNAIQHVRIVTIAALVVVGAAACAAPAAQPSSSPTASVAAAAALDDRPLDEQLVDAVVAGDVALAQLALDAGADPNQLDEASDSTPLRVAIIRDDLAMVTALIDAGAVAANDEGDHIFAAAQHGSAELTQLLLGAGSSAVGREGSEGEVLATAAYYGNTEALQVLIEAGGPVSGVFPAGPDRTYPVIVAAAFGGHLEAARILIANGADPAAVGWDGFTAAQWAENDGYVELADYLRSAGG